MEVKGKSAAISHLNQRDIQSFSARPDAAR
jgi:hypothetical protein